MKRVKITNGLYGYRPEGAKHPRPVPGGRLCVVTDTEAARLASLGVGVVLEDIPEEDTTGVVATPVEGEDDEGAGVDTPDQDEPAEGEETAHLDPSSSRSSPMPSSRSWPRKWASTPPSSRPRRS